MRIGIGGWSLHRVFGEKRLTILEFPGFAVREFGLAAIELNAPFFESLEEGYLRSMRRAAEDAGVQIAHIAVDDGDADLAATDEEFRRRSIARLRRWFVVAKTLGVSAFRVNTGGSDPATEREIASALESFKELVAEGERSGVKVTIENHGGISRNAEAIVRFMKEVGSPFLGTCPDFGNFPPEGRYEALRKVAPYAVVAHAKTWEFDEAGDEKTIDMRRAVGILREAGFDGDLLVEYEGKGDEVEGIHASIRLLRRILEGH